MLLLPIDEALKYSKRKLGEMRMEPLSRIRLLSVDL